MAQKQIGTIDAETDPFKFGRTPAPFVWGLYLEDEYVHFWGDDCTSELMEYIQDMDDIILYAHNGGKFDFFFMLEYLDPEVFIINGRISKATLFGGRIEIRDSWLILPLPLSAHDKGSIEYWKLEREHRETYKKDILAYLYQDCQSLHSWVMNFRDQFGGGLTLATSAFKQLRLTDYPMEPTNEFFDDQIRPYYFGGRVQCFEVGKFTGKRKPLKYVDINSAYSKAMMEPHWVGGNFRELKDFPAGDNGSWFATVDAISSGALPFKHEEKGQTKLYFPDDKFERTYQASGWEILAGLRTGTLEITHIHKVVTPITRSSFREYVQRFFKMKHDAEQAGNATLRQFAKFMLNACYGKFGQDGRNFEKFLIMEWGEVPDPWTDREGNEQPWHHYADTETLQRLYSRPDPVNRFYNVGTAASVTGYVRAMLWEAICASERPLYCDTDSIICEDFHGDMGKDIGQWDLEAEFSEVYIAQRKMYAGRVFPVGNYGPVNETKVASKGVRLNYEQIKAGVENKQNLVFEREAPAFSLKYGPRFFDRTIDFENISKNACNNPPIIYTDISGKSYQVN